MACDAATLRRICHVPAAGGAVDVWLASLDAPAAALDRFGASLPEVDCLPARAPASAQRERILASRWLLRVVLSRYLGEAPEQIRLERDGDGRPRLAGAGSGALDFNLARSGPAVAFAVSRIGAVGIDLERIRTVRAAREVASRYFSTEEQQALERTPPQRQAEAFFACWTRKEAYLKARGEGIRRPMRWFDVTVDPGEPARLLRVEGESKDLSDWRLQDVYAGAGYRAALAWNAVRLQSAALADHRPMTVDR